MREGLIYLRLLAFFFCVLGVFVLYFSHHSISSFIGNKRHNILFIEKPKKPYK
jgi:hypothetical protein